VEQLKYKKLEVIQPRIKNKSELSVGEKTIPGQSTLSFAVVIDLYSLSFISEGGGLGGGLGGGGLINFPLKKGRGY